MRRFAFWVVLSGFFLASSGLAAELQADLQDALERGDSAALEALAAPYRQGDLPPEISPLTTLLLGIAMMDTPARAITLFEAAAKDPALAVRARIWLVDAFLAARSPLGAQYYANELRRISPASPAIFYAQGRIALYSLLRTHPNWQARRDPLVEQILGSLKGCTDEYAQKHRDFDPRFFSLGLAYLDAETNLARAAGYATRFLTFRPRNASVTRLVLAIDDSLLYMKRTADIEALRKKGALSEDEWARWDERFRAYDLNTHRAWHQRLADESMGESEGAADLRAQRLPIHLTLMRQSADTWKSWLEARNRPPRGGDIEPPQGDPRFPEHALTFARLSTQGFTPGFAARALEYLEMARIIEPTLVVPDAMELELSSAVSDFTRGAPYFAREFPQHQADEAWLRRYMPVAEASAPEVFQRYVEALAKANPSLRTGRLLTARARVAEPGALARYEEIFSGAPGAVDPKAVDWDLYRELLQEAGNRAGFLDGGGPGKGPAAAFDATVERWHKAAGDRTGVAEQYALLLLRRARASASHEAYDAAFDALVRALNGASQNPAIVRGVTEVQSLTSGLRARERQREAELNAAIEEGLAKDRAAPEEPDDSDDVDVP